MSWRPDLQLTVDGVDVAASGLGMVTVRRGRDDPFTQPRAGYGRLQLLDTADPPSLLVPVALSIDVDGTTVSLWGGEVSDVDVELTDYGTLGSTIVSAITAVGPLARVHRGQVDPDGYAQQLDGARIAEVLVDAVAARYSTVAGDLRYVDLPAGRAFVDSDLVDVDQVDAGVYVLEADYAGSDPWKIVQQAALDGGGMLYETRTGQIGYADSDRRLAEVQASGYLSLPAAAVLPTSIRAAASFGEVANVVELTYASGTVEARNDDAIRRYGAVIAERVQTRLLNLADAELRADLVATLRASEVRRIERIDLDLGASTLSPAERVELLSIDPGQAIRLDGLPEQLVPGTWTGFVEAVELTVDRFTARLSLTVSPYELSTFGGRWSSMPDDLAWQDADPTVDWTQAEELL